MPLDTSRSGEAASRPGWHTCWFHTCSQTTSKARHRRAPAARASQLRFLQGDFSYVSFPTDLFLIKRQHPFPRERHSIVTHTEPGGNRPGLKMWAHLHSSEDAYFNSHVNVYSLNAEIQQRNELDKSLHTAPLQLLLMQHVHSANGASCVHCSDPNLPSYALDWSPTGLLVWPVS